MKEEAKKRIAHDMDVNDWREILRKHIEARKKRVPENLDEALGVFRPTRCFVKIPDLNFFALTVKEVAEVVEEVRRIAPGVLISTLHDSLCIEFPEDE